MKRFLKLFVMIAVFTGVAFGVLFSLSLSLTHHANPFSLFIIGLVSGLMFGVLFGLFFTVALMFFERKPVSEFANPNFHYACSIVAVLLGVYLFWVRLYTFSYIGGVFIMLPFYYWIRFGLNKNIDNYARFYATPVEKRPFSRELQKMNWKTMYPIMIGIFILMSAIITIRGNLVISFLGAMIWGFILAPEYKKIYLKAQGMISVAK